MRIPTHQIHNILNTYVRRLKAVHGTRDDNTGAAADDRMDSGPSDTGRRWIIDKISADIIHRLLRSEASAPPDPSLEGQETPSPPARTTPRNPSEELIHYHVLSPDGKKISETIRVQDPDFLIRQIEETARNGWK